MSNRQTFEEFWAILFENDWQIAFQAFVFGNFFFMLSLMQGSWVLYNDHEYGNIAASIVTVICVCSIVFWYMRVYTKWAHTLQKVLHANPSLTTFVVCSLLVFCCRSVAGIFVYLLCCMCYNACMYILNVCMYACTLLGVD
jgi:hypothetical protein